MVSRNLKTFSVSIMVCIFSVTSLSFAQKSYKELVFSKLRDVSLPEIFERTLDNGMKLFLVEDHDFPIISMTALIRTGSLYEPAAQTGLASLTGQVMRTGGTMSISGDELDEFLENRGASVEVSIGLNSATASLFSLKENLQEVLETYADVLIKPALPEDKLELAKIQTMTAISRRNDNISAIAQREFKKIIYGADSPFARTTEYNTIGVISRDDLQEFHQKYFHPNNTIVGIIGDFETEEIVEYLNNVFGSWERGNIDFPNKPAVEYEFRFGVYLIDKKDAVQTNIILGHIGITRDNPDYFAVTVMNTILGGGFTSRLFSRVRTQEGLAYSIGGSLGSNYDYPGMFSAACQTKTETTVKAGKIILEEIERLTNEPVTKEELNLAKEGFLNRFVFNFDSKSEVLNRLLTYKYFDYPDDFIIQIKNNVEKVTIWDVQRVAQKYLHPDIVQILFVGNAESFDEPVSEFGKVTPVDITIPEPQQ